MSFFDLFFIAIGLAMDAFAVSITNSLGNNKKSTLTFSAFVFGLFQALMPLTGYILGNVVTSHLTKYSNLIGFLLLAAIGGNSIYESIKSKGQDEKKQSISCKIILLQAIATSIDALAVGVTFSVLSVNIINASIIIGIITTIICLIGNILGKLFGNMLGNKSEFIGGAILIIIGIKILLS